MTELLVIAVMGRPWIGAMSVAEICWWSLSAVTSTEVTIGPGKVRKIYRLIGIMELGCQTPVLAATAQGT